ncbi:MAG TPA: prolyl oligopeptidase family serine peptidase [Usitatibacter sp.]|jgi:prolyl oligopeptidase|nr:prolyl oligopeptidase family serine peptidase [Usitatibacter sp.]
MKTLPLLSCLAPIALALAVHAQPVPDAVPPDATPPKESAPPEAPKPAPAPAAKPVVPPATPPAGAPFTGTMHGQAVQDPFRALENESSEETRAYLEQQGTRTREALDRIPARAALLERVRALDASTTAITDVQLSGSHVYYLRRNPSDSVPVIAMRDGLRGAERVVIDPSARGPALWIEWYRISPDGHHVAYGVSREGAGTILRVAATQTGRDLPFEIDRTRFNRHLAWHPDSRSFYYARESDGDAGPGRRGALRVYRHVLGRETSKDEVVFAAGVGGAREVPRYGVPYLDLPAQSHFAYAIVREGNRREFSMHVTDVRDLAAGKPHWRRLFGTDDGVVALAAGKDDLYLLTDHDAPNFRVVQLKGSAASLAGARVVVPPRDLVVESIALARDGLYLRTALAGVDRLERVPLGFFGARNVEYLRTPFDNAISEIVADPNRAGVLLRTQGYIDPPQLLELDARTGDSRNTGIIPASGADFSAMDQVRLYAPGEGGMKIPVTLVYRKGTQLTSRNPTLLVAYGSYGQTVEPAFDPMRLAWLERGGVFAVAHVRGGGEYGNAWHQAAAGAAKVNSARDVVAVAEFLQHYGFTDPAHLAVAGTRAGAIAVGGAAVVHPELFAAVLARAPITDLLRAEFGPGGAADVPEFGSVATAKGFEALRSASPYEQVKDHTPYPAVMLTVGLNDAAVAPWHAAKMAARLQAASSSGKPVLLRVEPGTGEGSRLPRAQRDAQRADVYAFLLWQLGDPQFQPR